MRESIYERISRELGISHSKVKIPTMQEAEKLKCQVELRSVEAFEKVYVIFRFCGYPDNYCERHAVETIFEAFRIGQNIFNTMYDNE